MDNVRDMSSGLTPEEIESRELRSDLIYHAETLADKLVTAALDSTDKQVKAAITRCNKFLQDMDKYLTEAGDATPES